MTGRSVPSMAKIVAYWSEGFTSPEVAAEVFGKNFEACFIGWGEPFCFGCGWLAPVDDTQPPEKSWRDAGMWLDRAHLVPVMRGGDDDCDNLIPLCTPCHRGIDHKILYTGELCTREMIVQAVIDLPRCSVGAQWLSDHLYGAHGGDAQAALWELEEIQRRHPHWTAFQSISGAIVSHAYGHEVRQHASERQTVHYGQ